ncbi:AAA family ATPase [Actinomyces minihominis]|uniref:AAA family ATPase n=1 Tax=Actinomyces minihominis TaxID=2002838 RepID=UPI0013EA2D5F|nr:AAA family ATPase [Actinomyces minihominis]
MQQPTPRDDSFPPTVLSIGAVDAIRRRLDEDDSSWRIIIDGPSGSGKTTIATELGEALGLSVLNLEEWVPGWDGLAEGTRITEELLSGERTGYHRWDWYQERYEEFAPVDLSGRWILEGCGSLTPVTAQFADLRLWVEAEPEVAKARGLERDGARFAPHWQRWHDQEVRHWEQDNPRGLADLIIRT